MVRHVCEVTDRESEGKSIVLAHPTNDAILNIGEFLIDVNDLWHSIKYNPYFRQWIIFDWSEFYRALYKTTLESILLYAPVWLTVPHINEINWS